MSNTNFDNGAPGSVGFINTASSDIKNGDKLAFLVIQDDKKAVFDAVAPITMVRIKSKSDYTLTKSLASDFMIAAFGEQPVSITIQGLHVLRNALTAQSVPITQWYRDNRIGAGNDRRVTITIQLNNSPVTYNCAVVALDIDGSKDLMSTGVVQYTLTLVGVELDTDKNE